MQDIAERVRIEAIYERLVEAMALADGSRDALLGAKLCDCLAYVETLVAALGDKGL